ncbi:hypothetical protein L204_102058 [Cryptococcus depauperatus]
MQSQRHSYPEAGQSSAIPISRPSSTSPRQTPQHFEQSPNETARTVHSTYSSLPFSYGSPFGYSAQKDRQYGGGPSFRYRDRRNQAGNSPSPSAKTGANLSLSHGSSLMGERSDELGNWRALHEVSGEDAKEDESNKSKFSISRLPSLPTPGGRGPRLMFVQSSPTATRALEIDRTPLFTRDSTGMLDQLSSSPSPLERDLTNYPFIAPGDQSTPRAAAQVLPSSDPTEMLPVEDHLDTTAVNHASPVTVPVSTSPRKVMSQSFWQRNWPPSLVIVNILKCSLAYLIASLFTFVPALASVLSTQSETDAHGRTNAKPAYSAHMVATIVVYFNPAKSLGNMLLSTRYCFVLALISIVISLLSQLTLQIFDHYSPSHGKSWDWVSEMGDWVVCLLWIGGTMGVLAWSKLWVGNPSFNSGCSMAAMIIYNVVIKEGALPKLLEIILIVLTGVCITNIICFIVFPVSATMKLQASISKSLKSFSTLLDLLTSTFLLEKNTIKENKTTVKDAVRDHSAAFKTLQKDLTEAKHERVLDGRIRGRRLHLYNAAITSLGRLAQHLSGLRSSTRLQEALIRAKQEGKISLDFDTLDGTSKLSVSAVGLEDEQGRAKKGFGTPEDDIDTSVKLFMKFREIAGAQMGALNNHCDQALEAVQALSKSGQTTSIDLSSIRSSLVLSLKDFSRYSSRAIKRVYAGPRRKGGVYLKRRHEERTSVNDNDIISSSDEDEVNHIRDETYVNGGDKQEEDLLNQKQLNDGPNETVFWIYFFLFTFEEFAREIVFLIDTMDEIVTAENVTAWEHLKSVMLRKRNKTEKRSEYLYKQLQNIVPIDPSQLQPPLYPKNTRNSIGPVIVPELDSLSWIGKTKQVFWAVGERLRQPDARYAIKTGLGGAILAAPAYTEVGRPIFLRYRGEWALIAYFATMSQTIGQTNLLSIARILGTLIGAGVAVLFTNLFPDNNIALPILGFLFSIPCFYVITQMPDYMNAGRFVLLTYNLTCLYAYNTRSRGDTTVEVIAFRRATSVIVGLLWAALVSRYWWPFTARRELRMGLSDFCLDLSYLYSKLVTAYSKGAEDSHSNSDGADIADEEAPLLSSDAIGHPHLSDSVRQFMAMEVHLQSQLSSLKSLLTHTKNEPRLKGPFAYDYYKEVLLSCERMLDKLHSMRCVTTRDEWDNGIRQSFIIPVNKERKAMAGNVILYFYTLSAGFRLRTPVPPYLPPAEEARQNLVAAIRSLDVVKRKSVRGGGRHLLYFAYALAMQEVIAELEYLGAMMQDAFGVISHGSAEDFEELFEEAPKDSIKDGRRERS